MTTSVALVTGANKGIGLETVRQLLDQGWTVWLGARDADRGRAAFDTVRDEGHAGEVRLVSIDVTDDASVAAAATRVAETGLDLLVNNAGIGTAAYSSAEDATANELSDSVAVNLLGPARVTHAFLPVLRQSTSPRVVNVSSGLGSFGVMTERGTHAAEFLDLVYPTTKAALNMLTVQYAKSLPDVRFVLVEPGYTATDLNGHSGPQTPQQAGANVVRAALGDLSTTSYVGPDGPLPW